MGKDQSCRSMFPLSAAVVMFATIATPSPVFGWQVQLFAPETYSENTAAMDAALGVHGLTIEDFEDVNLVSGLQVSTSTPNSGPRVALPQVYLDGSGFFTGNSWAGPGALVNTTDNVIWCSPARCDLSGIAARTTFTVGGVKRFGVGLGNLQGDVRDHAVFVNGVEVVPRLESLAGFVSGINGRNGYLVISADPGESIDSVSIEVRANGTSEPVCCDNGDGLVFDHVAFGDPAELSSLTLSSSVVAGCKRVTGRVALSAAAPPGGRIVTIAETLESATAPLTVTVPAGATTGTFAIRTVPVAATETSTVTVTLGATSLNRELSVRPMSLTSVRLSPTIIAGSQPVTGTATLECNAGPGPITVDLSSNNAGVAYPVASSVVVPQGLKSASFDVATNTVQAKSYATIAGTANDITKSKKLTVNVAAAVSPTSLRFGSVAVGQTAGPLSTMLTNKGAVPFSVSSISLTGTGAAWFAHTNNCPASLVAGASCVISVTFTPQTALTKSAKLSIATSATSTPLSVSLSGTGI